MSVLTISVWVLAISICCCFLLGLLTKNYSWVDRLWSILPPVYAAIWLPEYIHNPRYIIAAALVLLWGIRLTWNFAIKGGYACSFTSGFTGEDYRWAYLRKKIGNHLLFEIFNAVFISAYQLLVIFGFTLPLYFYGTYTTPVSRLEYVLYGFHVLLLCIETIADLQQYRFYKRRNALPWKHQPRYQLGFNTFGLWKYSRHPNYVGEMGQWVVVYGYLSAVSEFLHWSGIGAVLLILLFLGSTRFTEGITASKYPAYRNWQQCTGMWFPTFRNRKQRLFFRKYQL